MPRYKTSYFVAKDWEPAWTAAALEHVREEWVAHYRPPAAPAVSTPAVCIFINIYIVIDNTLQG